MTENRPVMRFVLVAAEYLSLAALGFIGVALDIDPNTQTLGEFWRFLVQFVGKYPIHSIGLSLLLNLGAKALLAMFRPDSKQLLRVRKTVDEELEKFRRTCFRELPESVPDDDNRVTVFERVQTLKWIWPWRGLWPWGLALPCSGWLVVRYRSARIIHEIVFRVL